MSGNVAIVRRFLDQFEPVGARLVARGWILAHNGAELRGIEVETYSPRPCELQSAELQSSPDLVAAFPQHPGAARGRFQVALALDAAPLAAMRVAVLVLVLRFTFSDGRICSWCLGRGLPTPPEALLHRIGGAPEVGLEFLGYFLDYGRLARDATVLDLGCGVGRMALPLQQYLGSTGRYHGFDVDRQLIEWCAHHVERTDPRFSFRHLPVRNAAYNPRERVDPVQLTLAVDPGTITFAFATSVFTHLQGAHARHYLREFGRVLRRGGRVLITAYLVEPGADNRVLVEGRTVSFVPLDGDTWTTDRSLPENATGFPFEAMVHWAEQAGLRCCESVRGAWRDHADGQSCQDMLVFQKP